MCEKIFTHLTPHLFALLISVLSWISGWLTSQHFGRGAQVPPLVVMTVALLCGDGVTQRRSSILWHTQKLATTVHFIGGRGGLCYVVCGGAMLKEGSN